MQPEMPRSTVPLFCGFHSTSGPHAGCGFGTQLLTGGFGLSVLIKLGGLTDPCGFLVACVFLSPKGPAPVQGLGLSTFFCPPRVQLTPHPHPWSSRSPVGSMYVVGLFPEYV